MDDLAVLQLALRSTAVLVRVSLIFAFLPILGEDFTPPRVRVLIAAGLTVCLIPVVPVDAGALPETTGQLLVMMIPEFLLGLLMGLTARLVFSAVQFAGQFAGEQIGFGIANVIDPTNSQQISITAQLYFLFSLLMFLALNGHHILIRALVRSFEIVPLFSLHISSELVDFMNGQVLQMFAVAAMIAAPVVAAMLLSNLALGLVCKAVPQINIFIESFPIHIGLGLLVLGLTFGSLGALLATRFTRLDQDLNTLLQLLK